MIPTIGVMVAAYIFTRCVEMVGSGATGAVTKLFAGLTALVALLSAVDLLIAGARGIPGLPRF